MIRTAGHWGIDAGTDPANRGVWLGGDKLGSIGITVRRGVSFHGLALNVNTDMEPFSWINPCGLNQVRMTSFERYLDASPSPWPRPGR
jgi:lipoate-protein ligase B